MHTQTANYIFDTDDNCDIYVASRSSVATIDPTFIFLKSDANAMRQ